MYIHIYVYITYIYILYIYIYIYPCPCGMGGLEPVATQICSVLEGSSEAQPYYQSNSEPGHSTDRNIHVYEYVCIYIYIYIISDQRTNMVPALEDHRTPRVCLPNYQILCISLSLSIYIYMHICI